MIDSWWLSNTWFLAIVRVLWIPWENHAPSCTGIRPAGWLGEMFASGWGADKPRPEMGRVSQGKGDRLLAGTWVTEPGFVVVTAACPVVARGMQNECGKMLGVWLWLLSPPLRAVIRRVLVIWSPGGPGAGSSKRTVSTLLWLEKTSFLPSLEKKLTEYLSTSISFFVWGGGDIFAWHSNSCPSLLSLSGNKMHEN